MKVSQLFRRKPIAHFPLREEGLLRCLSGIDLTFLGVGAIIGAGIFVLTGIAAATKAGPGIILSFILAGIACGFAAFAYAELSSCIGGSGSAYGYSYAGLGEIVAWIIGWELLLEYSLSSSVVAIGWSGYVQDLFTSVGLSPPENLVKNPFDGGFINLPAVLIILFITFMLSMGVRESARVNKIIVLIKLAVILLFIILAGWHFDPLKNWQPFLPFGWYGIVTGASLVFFAYIGFDAVSTAAEEAHNPQRDMPFGIIASLIICTVLYVLVAALLTAAVPYSHLNVSSPITEALLAMGYRFGGGLVGLGAIAGLTSVILVMQFGLTRIFLAIARDGLIPKSFGKISAKTNTPLRIVISSGVVTSFLAGFMPIHNIAELVNIGTLSAFSVVCVGVMVLRYTHPDLNRPFRTPFSPLIPALGFIFCIYLMLSLSALTWIFFGFWTGIGLVFYFFYGRKHSYLT